MLQPKSRQDAEIFYQTGHSPSLTQRIANIVQIDAVLRKELEIQYPELQIPALSFGVLSVVESDELFLKERGSLDPMRTSAISSIGEISFNPSSPDRHWVFYLCHDIGLQIFYQNAPFNMRTNDVPYSSYHQALLGTVRLHFESESHTILRNANLLPASFLDILHALRCHSFFKKQSEPSKPVERMIAKLILDPKRETFSSFVKQRSTPQT